MFRSLVNLRSLRNLPSVVPVPAGRPNSTASTRLEEPAAIRQQRQLRQQQYEQQQQQFERGAGGQKPQDDSHDRVTPYGWLMLSIPLATFGLGCWQVQRKLWKENLVRELELQTSKPAVAFPRDSIDDLNDMEYQRIRVRGQFLHDREQIMGPRSLIAKKGDETKGGLITRQDTSIGFLVVTPFQVEGTEHIILVNRGWVPRHFVQPETRVAGNESGTVELEGVVRLAEKRPQFSPKQSGEQFLYRDIPAMCSRTGAQPFWLDADSASTVAGGPIGGQTRATLRNDHLSYLVTWYSLSAVTAFLWYRQIYKRIPR